VSALIEKVTSQRLEREIEELRDQQRQGLLFVDEAYFQELAASEKAKEEELRRRKAGYEELREVLSRERDRVLKNVIPKRFTLRGDAQVFPISVEVRFREVKS
jgi:predicted YcjX-like family ATPase